jgi:predicted Zn-ribbon and HTH transcriptional regulator
MKCGHTVTGRNPPEKCPDCGSEDIFTIELTDKLPPKVEDNIQGSIEGHGRGAGPPRICKCSQCGYETPKVRGVPCRNDKCPECGAPLCGHE